MHTHISCNDWFRTIQILCNIELNGYILTGSPHYSPSSLHRSRQRLLPSLWLFSLWLIIIPPPVFIRSPSSFIRIPISLFIRISSPLIVRISSPLFICISSPLLIRISSPFFIRISSPFFICISTPFLVHISSPFLVHISSPFLIRISTSLFINVPSPLLLSFKGLHSNPSISNL